MINEILDSVFENDWRFLIILEDTGRINVIPEDSLEELEGDFFDKLRAAPNYKLLKLKNYGIGIFVVADPYCERELSSQVYAFVDYINKLYL